MERAKCARVFSEAILAANVAALERAQGQRPSLARLDEARVRVVADASAGVRLELRTTTGAWQAVTSPRITSWPRQLLVVGPALGECLDDLIHSGASTRVVLIEPDPGIAALLLARRDLTALIASGRVCVLTGPDYGGAINCGRLVDVSTPPTLIVNGVLAAHRATDVAAAETIARRLVSEAEANADARRRFAGRYLLQTLANLDVIAREGHVKTLDGLAAGQPAVIVGAGPSLDAQLPALAALQDRAVIIGADTVLRPLLAAGVRPHLLVGIDPAELNARHLAGVDGLEDVHLAAEGSLHPQAFTGFVDRTFVFAVSDHHPWPWLRAAGLDRGTLRAWGSVVTTAFDLAVRLGCAPIVFAGLDLSYPVRRPYCANTIYDDTWRDAITTYGCTWEQLVDDYFGRLADLRVPDLHGQPVLTAPHLVSFRDWLRQQTSADTSRRFVNTTGAGILHGPRIEQATLDDVLARQASIGPAVREALRRARRTARDQGAVAHALRDRLAHPEHPDTQALLAEWRAFTADTVTNDAIRQALSP